MEFAHKNPRKHLFEAQDVYLWNQKRRYLLPVLPTLVGFTLKLICKWYYIQRWRIFWASKQHSVECTSDIKRI